MFVLYVQGNRLRIHVNCEGPVDLFVIVVIIITMMICLQCHKHSAGMKLYGYRPQRIVKIIITLMICKIDASRPTMKQREKIHMCVHQGSARHPDPLNT
jgi:hypothetical protein